MYFLVNRNLTCQLLENLTGGGGGGGGEGWKLPFSTHFSSKATPVLKVMTISVWEMFGNLY